MEYAKQARKYKIEKKNRLRQRWSETEREEKKTPILLITFIYTYRVHVNNSIKLMLRHTLNNRKCHRKQNHNNHTKSTLRMPESMNHFFNETQTVRMRKITNRRASKKKHMLRNIIV